MNPNAISLAVKGLRSAYDSYSNYRDKKAVELYDTMQEAREVAAARNEAAKDAASTWTGDVKKKISDAREQSAEQADELTNRVEKKSKQAKKDAKLKDKETRCKTRCEAKKAEKKARKTRRGLETRTQKAIDKVTSEEGQRIKNDHIATASLVFTVVAAIVGVIVWKLRKDDKFPVDPAPYRQKIEALETKVEDKAAGVKETVEEKASKAKERAEEVKDKATGKVDEAKDKVAEAKKATEGKAAGASKQAQIKIDEVKTEEKNADDAKEISSKPSKPAPKPGQVRKK